VREGDELRTGAATLNGKETVIGTAMLLIGENSRAVAQRVAAKLRDIAKSLPDGILARTIYDRTNLVEATIAIVGRNLVEGAVLVIVILLLFLGNIRAAFITALVIPLSMLFTMTAMVETKVSANLMSLGAIDFGIIIDGVVIIIENCLRLLAAEQHKRVRLLSRAERLETIFAGARGVASLSLFGMMIIAIVYLPILTLTGVEGKMFTPMAMTVLMALTGAAICSMTFVPAALALVMTGRVSEHENAFMRLARRGGDSGSCRSRCPECSCRLAHGPGVYSEFGRRRHCHSSRACARNESDSIIRDAGSLRKATAEDARGEGSFRTDGIGRDCNRSRSSIEF